MANDTVRLGFIGAGAICRDRHLPNLQGMSGVEFACVCNRSEGSGRRVAEKWGFAEVETDWRRLVSREDIDAVFIGTWPYMHQEMSRAILEAGKHVFCQARMCMNWHETLDMCAAAKEHSGLVHMICPPPQRLPWERLIRRLVGSDEFGELVDVRLECINGSNLKRDAVTWRERLDLSGIQVMQVGIYAETLNAWVGDYAHLAAVTSTPIASKKGDDGKPYAIGIPQIVTVQGVLQNGATVTEHHSGVAVGFSRAEVTLFGSKGTLHLDVDTGALSLATSGKELKPFQPAADQLDGWRVEEDFIAAVRAARQGSSWQVSPDYFEGARYMRKMQAIHDSATSGQTIDLDAVFPLP